MNKDEFCCDICGEFIPDTEDCYEYHYDIICEKCLFAIFLKDHNLDKRLTQDDIDDDDFFIWDRFREKHLF